MYFTVVHLLTFFISSTLTQIFFTVTQISYSLQQKYRNYFHFRGGSKKNEKNGSINPSGLAGWSLAGCQREEVYPATFLQPTIWCFIKFMGFPDIAHFATRQKICQSISWQNLQHHQSRQHYQYLHQLENINCNNKCKILIQRNAENIASCLPLYIIYI